MISLEEIHQMSLHEKLFVMETLWEDISRNEGQMEVPQWHKDLLDTRAESVRQGRAEFVDLETAKQMVKKAVHEG